MLTYLYVHPMPLLFYLSLLASHEPVHWTIKCEQWSELAAEIRADEDLPEPNKSDLIDYFATKVEEECDELGRK